MYSTCVIGLVADNVDKGISQGLMKIYFLQTRASKVHAKIPGAKKSIVQRTLKWH